MEVFKRSELKKAIASSELIQEALETYPTTQYFLNCAYSDYGGDILDRLYCEVAKVKEGVIYFGENCLIPLTEDEVRQFEDYPIIGISAFDISYAEMEDKLSELHTQLVNKAIDYLKEDYKIINEEGLRDYLYGSRVYPTFINFNEDGLRSNNFIEKKEA